MTDFGRQPSELSSGQEGEAGGVELGCDPARIQPAASV